MNRIFYCDNGGEGSLEFQKAFWAVVRPHNLHCAAYTGAKASSRQSNQDASIRDDFYQADYIVVLFNREPNDSWVMPELEFAARSGRQISIYSTCKTPASLPLSIEGVVAISNPKEFGEKLLVEIAARL